MSRRGVGPGRSRAGMSWTATVIAITLAAAAALAVAAPSSPAAAQEIAGVALGPNGEPLVDAPVVLHRVGMGGGGAVAGRDTTGPNGEFTFPLAATDTAVYFAAIRYQDRLYVGPAAQGGGEPVTGYVLQVGPSSEIGAVSAAVGGTAGPPPARPSQATRQTGSDTGALWLVSLLALSAAAVFVFTAPRYRRRRTREAVIEVAAIENRLEDPAEEIAPDERERLTARRDQLREQLAPED